MSFDVMLFDTQDAPREREVFDQWFHGLNVWEGDLDYNDCRNATPSLQNFYRDIIRIYPSINGPDAPDSAAVESDPEMASRMTDYSIAPRLIYAAFAWSHAQDAEKLIHDLAARHGVGIYHVSTDNAVIFPDGLRL